MKVATWVLLFLVAGAAAAAGCSAGGTAPAAGTARAAEADAPTQAAAAAPHTRRVRSSRAADARIGDCESNRPNGLHEHLHWPLDGALSDIHIVPGAVQTPIRHTRCVYIHIWYTACVSMQQRKYIAAVQLFHRALSSHVGTHAHHNIRPPCQVVTGTAAIRIMVL